MSQVRKRRPWLIAAWLALGLSNVALGAIAFPIYTSFPAYRPTLFELQPLMNPCVGLGLIVSWVCFVFDRITTAGRAVYYGAVCIVLTCAVWAVNFAIMIPGKV